MDESSTIPATSSTIWRLQSNGWLSQTDLEKEVEWTDEVNIKLAGHNHERCVWVKREKRLMKRTAWQLLIIGVKIFCFWGFVWQSEVQETLHS